MEAKSEQAGGNPNPNFTIGGGGGGGEAMAADPNNFTIGGVEPRVFLENFSKEFFPESYAKDIGQHNSNFKQIEYTVVCNVLSAVRHAYEQKERLNKLLGEHDALKNSYEQLQKAGDADKEKIRDLENKLEELERGRDADKEKIRDLEKNLEDLGAQLKVAEEENVVEARRGAAEGNVMKKARKEGHDDNTNS